MRFLVMKPTQRPANGPGKVVLNEPINEPCFGISLGMIGLTEESPVIAKDSGFDQESAGDVERSDLHVSSPLGGINPSNDRPRTLAGDRRFPDGRGTIASVDRPKVAQRGNSRALDC